MKMFTRVLCDDKVVPQQQQEYHRNECYAFTDDSRAKLKAKFMYAVYCYCSQQHFIRLKLINRLFALLKYRKKKNSVRIL